MPLRGEFDGIVNEVQRHLPQPGAISPHPRAGRQQLGAPIEALCLCQLPTGLRDHSQGGAHIHVFMVQLQLTRIAAGKVEHVANQSAQMLRVGVDLLDVLALSLWQRRIAFVAFLEQHPAQPDD